MARLYILTGPTGVGKSTVSKGIAEQLEKSVLLEGDDFYHQVIGSYVPAWEPGNHLDVFWKVCIDTINNYLNAGYDDYKEIDSKEALNETDIFCIRMNDLIINDENIEEFSYIIRMLKVQYFDDFSKYVCETKMIY